MSTLHAALADRVGQRRFDLWFGANTRLDYDGRSLRVSVPNQFFLEWMVANFRRDIETACQQVFGDCPTIQFHVDTTSVCSTDNSPAMPKASAVSESPKNAEPVLRLATPTLQSPQTPPAAGPSATERRRFANLNDFVAGESNRLAITSAEMVVRQPGQHTPLLLYGPTSVGKTHLLEGIWTALRRRHPRSTSLYLSAEQFTGQFLEALRGSGLPNFRRKYRSVGVLLIDDLQFFVGKRATQVELLHTIDAFLRDGRQLVFSADRSPGELAELGPELTTRLSAGLVCRIESPDYTTRLGIVANMARRMAMHVPVEVQQFVANRFTCHARELSGALCRLKAVSQSFGHPISMAMAEESLADLIRQNGRVVRLPDIEKAVCEVFGLEPASLHSEAKATRISHPRMLAMWLARKHTRAALSEIGCFFGHRSHSTVVSAQKRIDGWMATGRSLDLAERCWPVDDAIRQVERRLAAG
ncbi:MAG: chromosomal replication initiator protein DnaA [Planctomycetaceae bacterium]|nr:chromosomal replication initiator protein DnaA [Planctomycetaceae bacterium]